MPTLTKYRLGQQPLAVEVSPERVEESVAFATEVNTSKKDAGVKDLWYDKKSSSVGVHIMGHLGEQVLGMVLDLPVDTTVLPGGDSGHDMFLGDCRMQVKTSTLSKLIVNSHAAFKSDVAILVEYTGTAERDVPHLDPKFRIWGWITRDEFFKRAYRKDYGHGLRYVVDNDDLLPLADLLEYVQENF